MTEPKCPNVQQALRFNQGKPKTDYILEYPRFLIMLARVMEYGGEKYGDLNWKKGGKPDSEYLGAAMRHMAAYRSGESFDSESGCHHLAHAAWNLMTLLELNHKSEMVDKDKYDAAIERVKKSKELPSQIANIRFEIKEPNEEDKALYERIKRIARQVEMNKAKENARKEGHQIGVKQIMQDESPFVEPNNLPPISEEEQKILNEVRIIRQKQSMDQRDKYYDQKQKEIQ